MKHKIRGRTARAIAASIEDAVHAGGLAAGESLPTIRDLAGSLGVSPVTVAAAYRALQARGLVEGSRRRGSRIRPNPPSPLNPAPAAEPPEGTIDLASGNPDPALLPPVELVLKTGVFPGRGYGEPNDFRPLVAFAAGEFAADGIPADHLAVTSGALDAIERILREYLRPGDVVGVEDPTVPALVDLVRASGLAVEPLDVDAHGLRPDALDAAAARMRALILTPRAQNPTGAVLTPARAGDLRRVLKAHRDLLTIENDPCGPVAGAAAATVCEAQTHWAVVRSTSKFLGPDLRTAVVAGDALTIARLRGRQALGVRWVSHILQELTAMLWSDPGAARRLARAADIYAQRREALASALAAYGIQVTASSGLNVWIPVREETATVQALAQRGWSVAPGERFRLRSSPGIRVTTAALTTDQAALFAADCAAARASSAGAPA